MKEEIKTIFKIIIGLILMIPLTVWLEMPLTIEENNIILVICMISFGSGVYLFMDTTAKNMG